MARKHYHLLCALPDLKGFGSAPPLGKSALLAMVRDCGGPEGSIRLLFLGDDLLQREAVLCGEMDPEQADLAVLSPSQATDSQPLPEFLMPPGTEDEEMTRNPLAVDVIWRRYFFHAAGMAQGLRSRFLASWVAYEVGLRNAMARMRAETLGLDARPYLVAEELGKPPLAFDRELEEWRRASHPLAGLETLEKIRWQWLTEQEPRYDFSDDEVVAYGAKLMVLLRWRRMFRE